jgi:hypothetical protein
VLTLTPGEMHDIETAAAAITIVGDRLPKAILAFSYR